MSGLGWPGRGRRGAHGGAPTGGLGWPSRKPAPAADPRRAEEPSDRGPLSSEDDRLTEATTPRTGPSPDAPTPLPAVLPPELRTGPEAPIAPVVLAAPVEAVQATDPLSVAETAPPPPAPTPVPDHVASRPG